MKVLYIDSDPVMRDYVSMCLEAELECEILEASSGNEALIILQIESDYNLILTDVELIGGGVTVVLEYLKEHEIKSPIVWISKKENKNNPIITEYCATNPESYFIPKPFKDDEFFPIIRKAMTFMPDSEFNRDDHNTPDLLRDDISLDENSDGEDSLFSQVQKANNKEIKKTQVFAREKENFDSMWSSKENKSYSKEQLQKELSLKNQDDEPKERQFYEEKVANWSLKKDKYVKGKEVAADWSINKKEYLKDQQIDADWSLADTEQEVSAKVKRPLEYTDSSLKKEKSEIDEEGELPTKQTLIASIETESTKELLSKTRIQRQKEVDKDLDYDKSKYKRVAIKRILNLPLVPCNVFIKIGLKKYIKIIYPEEEYSIQSIKNYQDKNVRYLFILTKEHPKFMEVFGDKVINMITSAKKVGGKAQTMAELIGFDHIISQVTSVGISSKTSKVVTNVIESNIESLESLKGVKDVIKNMLEGKNYISEHSMVLSYVCGQISLKTSWNSRANLEKLCMAAMLHDCYFSDSNLAEIHDLSPGQINDLDKSDQNIIKQHPGEAAKIISQGASVFPDVETIILQHHETVSANGYPRKLGPLTISPLACIFIMAHEFTNEVFKNGKENLNYDDIKNDFSEKFKRGNFKKSLDAFMKAF